MIQGAQPVLFPYSMQIQRCIFEQATATSNSIVSSSSNSVVDPQTPTAVVIQSSRAVIISDSIFTGLGVPAINNNQVASVPASAAVRVIDSSLISFQRCNFSLHAAMMGAALNM
jgi:hypothetical protein